MESNQNRKTNLKIIAVVIIAIAALIGGCVCSINIQKHNVNSNQSMEQRSNTKNDSINLNLMK